MKDYKVVITKPDGSSNTVTIDSYVADGTAWFPYLADQVGEWELQFFFIGMYHPPGWYNNGEYSTEPFVDPISGDDAMWYDGNYYNPTNTPVQTLTVQEEFVWSWPLIDLPTDYWTRPISMERRDWPRSQATTHGMKIAIFLIPGAVTPHTMAPTSQHQTLHILSGKNKMT